MMKQILYISGNDLNHETAELPTRAFRVVLLFVMVSIFGSSVRGQSVADDATINVSDTYSTYDEVSEWVADWKTPEEGTVPAHTAGVWVGLRWSGRLLGSASDLSSALTATKPAQLVPGVVRKAMYRATENARGSDGDATEQQTRIDRLHEIPAIVEMQFAYHLQRVHGTTITALAKNIRPGLDGVLLRDKDDIVGVFPVEMMINDTRPAAAIDILRVDMQMTTEEFNAQLADGRIRVWKFEVVHLVQESHTTPPVVLYRGSRIVPLEWVTQPHSVEFADEVAQHLINRMWPGEEHLGIMGTYLADVDRYDPLTADTVDQALAAFALANYASWRQTTSPKFAGSAIKAAQRILVDLAARESSGSNSSRTPGESALIVIAVDAVNNYQLVSADIGMFRQQCMSQLERSFDKKSGRFNSSISISEQSACAYALGTREAVNAVWQVVSPEDLPSILPWIGWAEQKLAGADGTIPSATGLLNIRSKLWAIQAGALDPESAAPDEAGGFRFHRGESPDWNTTRPLIFLASMLGDQRFTNGENGSITEEIIHLTQAVRFLRQLSERVEDTYRFPDPDRAMNGTRATLWTDRLPVSASAGSLTALTEFNRSLETVSKQFANQNKPTRNTGSKR